MKAEIRKLSDRFHLELIAENEVEEILLNGFEEAVKQGFTPSTKHDLEEFTSYARPIHLTGGSARGDNLHTMTVSMQTLEPCHHEVTLKLEALSKQLSLKWYQKIFGGNK